MPVPGAERVTVAILAKAPIAGFAKTRLIPALGAHGAAILQERLTERAVTMAVAAELGPVVLWAAPDPGHRSFKDLASRFPIALHAQPDGDLGARMLAAFTQAQAATIVIGTDCPAITNHTIRQVADILQTIAEVAIIPAEDGGYVLIAARRPIPQLFADIRWSTPGVMAQTRRRIQALQLRAHELPPHWDVDEPVDYDRLERDFSTLAL